MRKLIAMILAGMLLISSAALAQGGAHVHQASGEWGRDKETHWAVCECGEALEAEAHTLVDIRCTVCGCVIWEYLDGYYEICHYDEYENLIRSTSYDADDRVIDDYVFEITYDEKGNQIHQETYVNGFLIEVTEYQMTADGWNVPLTQTGYDQEGGKSVSQYNAEGWLLHMLVTDAAGEMQYEEEYEYTLGENNETDQTRAVYRYQDGSSLVNVYDEYGANILNAFYDAAGQVETGSYTEHDYNEDGETIGSQSYDLITDRMLYQVIYEPYEDEYGTWYYERFFISYEEDGSRSITEYDNSYNELTVTYYNTSGQIETVFRNEYEFDDQGNVLLHNRFENDRLIESYQYEVIDEEEAFWYYMKISTEIDEDGSMYIVEYDKEGNEVSAGWFDENGESMPDKAE